MSDNTLWETIGGRKNFCSFKHYSKTELFCKHPNNVTSLCEQKSCPLSNSKYATVRENKGKLYLYMKEPERIKTPIYQYEVIELPQDYDKAITQIEEELKFYDPFLVHKCKQRLTNLTEYLERKEQIRLERENKQIPEFSVIRRRFMKKERISAVKTYRKMNIEKEIEKELIERMKAGVYGDELKYKLKNRDVVEQKEEAKKDKKIQKKKFIAYFEESDEDILSAEELKKMKGKNIKW